MKLPHVWTINLAVLCVYTYILYTQCCIAFLNPGSFFGCCALGIISEFSEVRFIRATETRRRVLHGSRDNGEKLEGRRREVYKLVSRVILIIGPDLHIERSARARF